MRDGSSHKPVTKCDWSRGTKCLRTPTPATAVVVVTLVLIVLVVVVIGVVVVVVVVVVVGRSQIKPKCSTSMDGANVAHPHYV